MRKHLKTILVCGILGLCVISLLFSYHFIWRTPTPQEVYSNSQYSVVELKSQTGEDIFWGGDKVYAFGNGMSYGIGITQGIISLPSVNIEYEENIRSVSFI